MMKVSASSLRLAEASYDLVKSGGVVFLKFRCGSGFRCTFHCEVGSGYVGGRSVSRQQTVWLTKLLRHPSWTLGKLWRRYPHTSVIRGYSTVIGNRNGVSVDSQSSAVEREGIYWRTRLGLVSKTMSKHVY